MGMLQCPVAVMANKIFGAACPDTQLAAAAVSRGITCFYHPELEPYHPIVGAAAGCSVRPRWLIRVQPLRLPCKRAVCALSWRTHNIP